MRRSQSIMCETIQANYEEVYLHELILALGNRFSVEIVTSEDSNSFLRIFCALLFFFK